MAMFAQILSIIFQSIGNAVVWVVSVFNNFGLNWLYVIAGGAILSLLLRLFVRAFIGDRLYGKASDLADAAWTKGKYSKSGHKPGYQGKFTKIKGVSGHRAGHKP